MKNVINEWRKVIEGNNEFELTKREECKEITQLNKIVTKGGEYMIQQCINCQTVWECKSNEIQPYCSNKCEEEYKEYIKALEKEFNC